MKNAGGSPEEMILRDKSPFIALALWGLMILGILYFFRGYSDYYLDRNRGSGNWISPRETMNSRKLYFGTKV